MSTNAAVPVTPGSGSNIATYQISESGENKQLQRIVPSDGLGNEYNSGNAFPTSTTNGALETGGNLATIATNTGNSATSANQTNGTQKTQIVSSGGTAAGVDANGNLDTTLNIKLDFVNDSITNYKLGHSYTNITTNTTTTVKSGAGVLVGITINNPAALTVANLTLTIYDNTAGSGTKIGTWTVPFGLTGAVPFKIPYELAFTTGLTIVTAGPTVTADITVEWR